MPRRTRSLRALCKAYRLHRHWQNGRRSGYPLCCTLRYVWDRLTFKRGSHLRRGVHKSPEMRFIPCGVLHKPTHGYHQLPNGQFRPVKY